MTDATVSPIPKEARPFQGLRAGLVTRLVAAVIDTVVVAVVLILAWAGYAGVRFLLDPRGFNLPNATLLFSFTISFCAAVLYLSVGWMISGRTYGCHVLGLRVVSYRGQRMRPLGAFARALFCVAFPIGLVWCLVSKANRSIQDVVLRSSVIYDWEPGSPWRHLPGHAMDQESRDPLTDVE